MCQYRLELHVLSMKRSGHHGLILWLSGLFDAPILHLNDVDMRSDPFLSSKGNSWTNQILGKCIEPSDGLNGRSGSDDCIILSYEDPDVTAIEGGSLPVNSTQWIRDSLRVERILCLRDPYNMLASRFALWPDDVRAMHEKILHRWCGHAHEFLGRTRRLGGALAVNFNAWFSQKAYRRELSARLNIPFSDRGFRPIPLGTIGGSSFGPRTDHDAAATDVLSRWRLYEEGHEFWLFFDAVPQVHDLSASIFGAVLGPDPDNVD